MILYNIIWPFDFDYNNTHALQTAKHMSFIFFFIVAYCLLLAALPTVFTLIFQKLLGFSKASIKLKHPFKFVRTILQIRQPIWGIQKITIFIPEIRISLDVKRFKICIAFDKPRVMLSRSRNQLLPLKIVDGLKQHNLLYNLVTIIKSIKTSKVTEKQANKRQSSRAVKEQSKLKVGIKAIIHFTTLIAIQFFQIKITNGDAAIVSPMSLDSRTIPQISDMRIQITLLQSFAEYFLFINELTVSASLHEDHEVNLSICCPLLKLYTAKHMEDVLIKSEKLDISLRIPFTFTFQKSMERLSVFVSASRLTSHSNPQDFQNLSKLLNQILFSEQIFASGSQKQQEKPQVENEEQGEQQNRSSKKIVISVQEAEIKMSDLCQIDEDTPEAQKYLSNISLAILKFQKVRLNEQGFMVGEVNLSVSKYKKINQFDQKQNLYSKQVLKINNLLINKQEHVNRISHDDVKISCQREELALLGKLFLLINSRVIIDEYDESIYLSFIDIARLYTQGQTPLPQTIEKLISRKQLSIEKRSKISQNKSIKHENSLIYSPKQIQLELDISELIHKIVLYSSQYRQIRTLAAQISHELTFKKITMDYKGTKQFQVNDFKLFYRQAETANELELQVADIHMMQNYSTLKDYFVGFTMFKLLLQFTSDEVEADPNAKKCTKSGKKSLNFGKITINYATQLLTLRKLSVMKQTTSDGKLSSLYFSLAKCDFSIERLYQTNKIMKYYLSHSHNLLSVNSITIKQFLTMGSAASLTPKQKYMINIKNPTMLLPEIDVSDRLMNYVKTFNKLEPTLQAFMKNTTDEKIRAKRRKYKIFMIDPDVYTLKVSNLCIGIEDSVFDRSMLNRMRFSREYLKKNPKYNESQTINFLRQTAQKFHLFELQIEEISVDIKPLDAAGNNEKSVKQWISNIKRKYNQEEVEDTETPRLIRVNNIYVELDIVNLTTKIRDYPFNLLSISKINGHLQYLKTKNIYEQTFHYLLSHVGIEEVSVQTGLSLLSGLQQVEKKLQKYKKSMDEYKNTQQFLHTLKTKGSIQLSSYKPYWHILHKSADWHISINKNSQIKMKLMTGLTPYSTQTLSLTLGPLSLVSNPIQTEFSIDFLQLDGNSFKIFQIGNQKVQITTKYDEPDLYIAVQYSIESENHRKSHKFKDNIMRVSEQIIRQLWKIKQLRTDWLILYGLIEPYSKRQENVLKRQEQSSYVELFKIAANMQLKNRDRELSIFSVLKEVKFIFRIDKFQLQLADQDNEVGLIINQLRFSLASEVRADKWKMRHFLVSLQTIIGRLKIYKKKNLALYESNQQFLDYFNKITQQDIINRPEERETFKQIFLVCRGLRLRVNEYVIINEEILYIGKKIQADSLKVQLTTELKKIIDSLFINIFEANKKKVDELTKNKYFKMSATQKLRESVVLVMRVNRKKKNFCEKVKLYINFKNIEVGFKTAKKLLLLTNNKPTFLKQDVTFNDKDLYRADPKISLNCEFKDVEIWVSSHPNNLWVLGKGYSPNMIANADRIIKCCGISLLLQKHENETVPPHYQQIIITEGIQRYTNLHVKVSNGTIELTRSNIQVLKEIGIILQTIVNSKQQKRRQWHTEKEKYSQMISNGRQDIKNKLSWKYSDLSKGPAASLQSKIFLTLDKINIGLVGAKSQEQNGENKEGQKSRGSGLTSTKSMKQKYMFMNLVSSDIEIQVELYSRQNLKKQFKINNLKIFNCLEPEESNFRTMFQMNHVDNLAVLIQIEECLLSATNPKVFWNFFKQVHIQFLPIKVRFTQELYNQIYYFFFGINPETDQKQEELSNILPDYFMSVLIDEIKVQAWYRTPSRLKRLEGVSVGLQKYEMKNQFLDNKTFFDRWANFVIKQLASQFFNVLGQKLFG